MDVDAVKMSLLDSVSIRHGSLVSACCEGLFIEGDDDAHKMKDAIVILLFSVTHRWFRSKRFGGRGHRWGAAPREPPAALQDVASWDPTENAKEVGLIDTRACRPSSGDHWTCG